MILDSMFYGTFVVVVSIIMSFVVFDIICNRVECVIARG